MKKTQLTPQRQSARAPAAFAIHAIAQPEAHRVHTEFAGHSPHICPGWAFGGTA